LSYQHLAAGKLCSGLLVSIHPGMLVNFPRNNHTRSPGSSGSAGGANAAGIGLPVCT
jgi:hypothetical protein